MPSTNGHEPKRAASYARVSTDEQGKSGYSIPDQLRENRSYAVREGIEIVEEIVDDGYSGASPDRPGLQRVMELAEAAAIDLVLATKRDRFFRSRLHRLLWDRDLEEYGVKLKALNDTGHRIGDGVQDDYAEWEREEIARRTMAGKLQKARQGKIIAGRQPDFGFEYNEARDGYVVNEEEMAVVRQIFRMFAIEGFSVNGVASALQKQGVQPPRGKRWQRQFVRECVLDDVYKPHAFAEVQELVSPEVATRLDPERSYGIWWYNRRSAKTVRVPVGLGQYTKRKRYAEKPKDEWIAVPVSESGIPKEIVEKARASLEKNERCSGAGRRFWELSGGIFRCAVCSHALVATTTRKGAKRKLYYYYQCATRRRVGKHACRFTKTLNAQKTEGDVWRAVCKVLSDPERLRQDLEAMIERERNNRSRPEAEAKAWAAKLAEVEHKRDKYQEMFAADAMTLDELRAKLKALEETRKTAERELALLEDRRERLEAMERDKDRLLDSYAALAPEHLGALSPEERRTVYSMLRLTVEALSDGGLKVSGAFGEETPVWETAGTSTR